VIGGYKNIMVRTQQHQLWRNGFTMKNEVDEGAHVEDGCDDG